MDIVNSGIVFDRRFYINIFNLKIYTYEKRMDETFNY